VEVRHGAFLLFLLSLLSIFLLPQDFRPTATSAALLLLALLLSSWGKGLRAGISYLRLNLPRDGLLPLLGWSAAALLSSCMVTGVISGILWLAGLLDTAPVEQKILSLPLLALVSAFTLAPFAEEALFRGYFFRRMQEAAGKKKAHSPVSVALAAVLSSLLFASLHFSYGSFSELAVAFFVGLALCAFVRKTGSLWPAVLAHASFNLLSVLFTVVL